MKFALIGAQLPELDVYSNYERTNELRNELLKKGLSFVGVQNISANKKSQLFMVTMPDEDELLSLARSFGQKAILISDEHHNIEVVSTKSKGRTCLGKFVPVTKTVAEDSKFYITFTEEGQTYFYVTQQGVTRVTKTGTGIQRTY